MSTPAINISSDIIIAKFRSICSNFSRTLISPDSSPSLAFCCSFSRAASMNFEVVLMKVRIVVSVQYYPSIKLTLSAHEDSE